MWTSKFLLYFYGKALLIRKYHNQCFEEAWFLRKITWKQHFSFSTLRLCKSDFTKIYYFDKHSDDVCVWNTVWKLRNFTATIFSQKFREINFLLKNFTLSWFDEKKLDGSEFLVFPHCVFDEIFWRNLRIKCWQTISVWLLGYFDQSIGIWFQEFSYPTLPWTDFRFIGDFKNTNLFWNNFF